MAPSYNVGMIMSLVLVTIWPAAAKPSNFIFFQPDEMRAESLGESSLHCMSQWAGRSSGAWFLLVSSSRSTSFRLPHAVHLVPSHPFSTVRLTQYFSLCSAAGCYGHPISQTPNFDSFAASATRFAQAHVSYTVCSQSRVAFATGWPTHVAGHRSLWALLHKWEPNLFKYFKVTCCLIHM